MKYTLPQFELVMLKTTDKDNDQALQGQGVRPTRKRA